MGFDPVTAAIGAGIALVGSGGDIESALAGGALGGFGGGLMSGMEGATASGMLAADNMALAGMGFSGADIAAGMAGLGEAGGALAGAGMLTEAASPGLSSFYGADQLPGFSEMMTDSALTGAGEVMTDGGGLSNYFSGAEQLGPMSTAQGAVAPEMSVGSFQPDAVLSKFAGAETPFYEQAYNAVNSATKPLQDVYNSPLGKTARAGKAGLDYLNRQEAYANQKQKMDAQLAAYQQGRPSPQPRYSPTQAFGYRNFNPMYGKV